MLKNRLLQSILTTMLIVAVLFPLFSIIFIFPQFVNLLTGHLENESVQNANHLKYTISDSITSLSNLPLSPYAQTNLMRAKDQLSFEKIKIFSKDGKIIFSTDSQDLGKPNTQDYFHTRVAKERNVTHLVEKDSTTLEGRSVKTEVIETYIPLMIDGEFHGAIEVYSDITHIRGAQKKLLTRLKQTILFFSIAMVIFLLVILIKASRNMIEKDHADKALQKIHEQLEILVDERTADLIDSNTRLSVKIQEKKSTKIALQRSHDTQAIVNTLLKESLGEASVQELLEQCLDRIFSLPWLPFESMGCIFLVEEDPEVLVMKAHRGFSAAHQKECTLLPFGKCLCGRAAIEKKIVFASRTDDRHNILMEGELDHGHYCVPILIKNTVLGLINIYIKQGHHRDREEEYFLETIANTLAGILNQRQGEAEKQVIQHQLLQSQKLESIGTLAGGIAHDFNNILTGIFGFSLMAKKHISEPEKTLKDIDRVIQCAQKATELVKQILTFSRKSDQKKYPVNFGLLVKEAVKLLRSSIPSTIQIQEKIATESKILADPIQIHQIIMNLCTNAYHAMEKTGGILTLSLDKIHFPDQETWLGMNISAGTYLKLEIADTGFGMDPKTLNKIFEPYFTTKETGKGTGLGLAVVHGIVTKHNGYVCVHSEPGQGSVFTIFFPATENQLFTPPRKEDRSRPGKGTEHILLVDDEESILTPMQQILEIHGYRVSSFSNGTEAFEEFQTDPDQFDLVITDMTMPEITGDKLAVNILKIRPNLPIILCSGYSETMSETRAKKLGIRKYIEKPFGLKGLAKTIRDLLDQQSIESAKKH